MRLRSCNIPFNKTKPCDPPEKVNDSRSPLFSSSEFYSLLEPHTPRKLRPDDEKVGYQTKIIPLIQINPMPYHSELMHCYGFKFEPTFSNSIYALLYRVLAVPSVTIPKKIDLPLTWLDQLTRFSYFYEPSELDYIQNLKPHQRLRITRAYADLDYSKNPPHSLDVFPKCDELLMKAKPRIIWSVPAFYQALLGPVIRAFTFYMKTVFDGIRIYTSPGGKHFTLKFACGLVAEDLDDWFNTSLAALRAGKVNWCGIFLGDDTAILYIENGIIKARESDFSAFDSTQRSAVQKRIIRIYSIVGVPDVFLPYFWSMCTSKLVVRYGPDRKYRFKITLKEPQTATGKPDTCVANTLINMDSTIHVMDGGKYSDYGFEAKTKFHDRIANVTFLKGYWCLDLKGKYVWNYLPSLSIKLLKTFSLNRMETLHGKICENLSSIGPCSAPLIDTLITRFLPSYKKVSTIFHVFAESWRPLNECKSHKFLVQRYGEDSPSLFLSLSSLLKTVSLGSVLYHPLWSRLASVDYGDGLVL